MLTLPSRPGSKTLVLLGEAPGAEEEKAGQPFVGPSGNLLRHHLLPMAGLDFSTWHVTNVFSQRPPNNDLKEWTANKTELKKLGLPSRGSPISKRYLLPQYWTQVETTEQLLLELKPSLIVALGAKAQWLLTGDDRIGTFRGNFFQTRFGPALSTFHPAAILREYKMLPVSVMDLIKVKHWLQGTLPPPLRRKLWVNPSWTEMEYVYSKFRAQPAIRLGADIETSPSTGQITTISFCSPLEGICIPLWDRYAGAGKESVHATPKDEVRAWRWIQKFALLPNPKVLQNGLYDMQYLLDAPIPIYLAGKIDDTAIMQHAYQPELRKDLGSLASFYLNEPSWKQMRTSAKDAKADD